MMDSMLDINSSCKFILPTVNSWQIEESRHPGPLWKLILMIWAKKIYIPLSWLSWLLIILILYNPHTWCGSVLHGQAMVTHISPQQKSHTQKILDHHPAPHSHLWVGAWARPNPRVPRAVLELRHPPVKWLVKVQCLKFCVSLVSHGLIL